jgi:hypothetical protein
MEVISTTGLFETFKKVTVFFTNQVGQSFTTYENGQYYVSGDFLYLVFPGTKRRSIVNMQLTHRIEIE